MFRLFNSYNIIFYSYAFGQFCLKSNAEKHFSDGSVRRKEIDVALIKMITKDFQPLSIVEDEGFRLFATTLNPSYTLLSQTPERNGSTEI